MTQSPPTIGANKSGLQYRGEDNDGKAAMLSSHKGNTAPSYAVAGTVWLDDNSAPWLLKIYDGADWITIGAVNATTNAITPFLGTGALKFINYATDSGAVNAYVVAPVPAVSAYTAGQMVTLRPANANTGASTLKVSDLTAPAIKLQNGDDTPEGAILAGGVYLLVYNGTNFTLLNPSSPPPASLPSGAVVPFAGSAAPTGYLLCDGSAISRSTYAALFAAIGTTWGVGDGSTTFNVPNMNGRGAIGAGSEDPNPTVRFISNVNGSTEVITTSAAHTFETGDAVLYEVNGGSAINNLTDGVTYYVTRISDTTLTLATTRNNALAGTAINVNNVTPSANTNRLTRTALASRSLGEYGGERLHRLLEENMPRHSHTMSPVNTGATGSSWNKGSGVSSNTAETGEKGSDVPHNNMPPFAVMNYIIKT